ncbi:MAG: FMN-binding protein, partial [Flavobacteriaceae bacterium]|nr:FMN-binding protein [Flavobacteriaceae bacterium]
RWLKQFIGLDQNSDIQYGNDIKAISGATISARALTIAINDLLKSVNYLRQKEII